MTKQSKIGVKFDDGKVPLNLLSNYALEELCRVLEFGAKKYDPWNWSKGIPYSRVIAAAKRHIAAWENRIDTDHESNINHLAHAMCNLMFILDFESRQLIELDDRRPKESLRKEPSWKKIKNISEVSKHTNGTQILNQTKKLKHSKRKTVKKVKKK